MSRNQAVAEAIAVVFFYVVLVWLVLQLTACSLSLEAERIAFDYSMLSSTELTKVDENGTTEKAVESPLESIMGEGQ